MLKLHYRDTEETKGRKTEGVKYNNYVIQHMEIIKQLKGMKRKRTNTVAIKRGDN